MEEIMSILLGYVKKQKILLAPYFGDGKMLLDFGYGDLPLAKVLHTEFPKLAITGVDMVDGGVRAEVIAFTLYDGKMTPFCP
jgi:hypothetical protein